MLDSRNAGNQEDLEECIFGISVTEFIWSLMWQYIHSESKKKICILQKKTQFYTQYIPKP